MGDTTHQKYSSVPIDDPMFQPFPSEIYFQNYEPFESVEVPFTLRNNDKVPRLVKVTQADSPYFKILSPHDIGHKVGPGLPTTFRIQFTPEDKKDYTHELVCITEREKFIVPVKCIGSRAILDFPDEVNFQISPVKHTSTKTLLVRNIGNRVAKFSLNAKSPFSVSPENGILPENESMQVTIEFKPMTIGDHDTDLVLSYDTGEDVVIGVYGVAQDSNIRLEKNSIRIENTYISMTNQRSLTITNRSNVITHFQWTSFATREEEDMQKSEFYNDLETAEDVETKRFLEECDWNPSLKDKLSLLTRTFMNKRKRVSNDKMLFTDDVFKVDPVESDIWPNSSLEVNIVFKPDEAVVYNRTIFCDIAGRESRLPLRIRGDGIGPAVQFSFEELDMGNIFVNSTHSYEVVLANKGDIDAIYNVVIPKTMFGPKFTFNPPEGIVMPDGHQAIQVTFTSEVLGDFEEEFQFQIDGAPERSKVKFCGSVIGPTFHFDVPKLKYGVISFGFPYVEECTLSNTSLVPMTFKLHIPGDGINDAISSESDTDVRKRVSNPKEFIITPNSGTLSPRSSQNIKVELISNWIRKYDMALVVDVEGVGKEILTLPIQARCVVPSINVLTPIIDFGRCFLNHEYENNVKMSNETDLPAKYEILPQEPDALTPISYYSPVPIGVIKAHSVADVPILMAAHALDELDVMSSIQVFGSPEPPMGVHISCIGEGPVVHISPEQLDWGVIPVLTDTQRTIVLSNESLIPAKFTAHMLRPNTVWKVEPRDGMIPAEQQATLTVTANLDDSVRFQDLLQINILNSQSRTISLAAYGQGTSIVSEPSFGPVLDLGPHFGSNECKRIFTLTNKGRRHQQLVWSTEGFPLVRSKKDSIPSNIKDIKFKNMPPSAAPPHPVFSLSPQRMDMAPGQSMEVVLSGQVDEPQQVRERMVCHAIIGRSGGKEMIKKIDIKVDFITPLLDFSSKQLFFRVDKRPDDVMDVQTRNLMVTNVSSLPLTAQLKLTYPFQLLVDGDTECFEYELCLEVGQEKSLCIQFDPAYKDDFHIRTVDEVLSVQYKEHPHVDYISLRGEVYFPNLEFEKEVIDFGCILNDTEVTRYINITNNSPMDVHYKWSFLIGDEPVAVRQSPVIFYDPPAVQVIEIANGDVDDDEEEPEEMQDDAMSLEDENEKIETVEQKIDENVEVGITLEKVESVLKESKSAKHVEIIDAKRSPPSSTGLAIDLDTECEKQDSEKDIDEQEGDIDVDVLAAEMIKPTKSASGQESPRPASSASKRITINPVLQSLLERDLSFDAPLGVEEVFDILPLYGHLAPGDTEQITLTFFGHAEIWSKAKAICEVEGGPAYDIVLQGEASLVEYRFDVNDIDYGKQMYDEVAASEITLINCGKVGFEFSALGMDPEEVGKPRPGIPVMIPHTGYIEPMSQQNLTIKFLAGIPEKFFKSFMIQVAHFEPDTINLFGEGVFPRISLDLPRFGDEEGVYSTLLKDSREALCKDVIKVDKDHHTSSHRSTARSGTDSNVDVLHEHLPSELEIQMEVERMMVKEFSEQQNNLESSNVDMLLVDSNRRLSQDQSSLKSHKSKKTKKKLKPRPRLADYLLDFGYVVLGTVRTHIVRATNTGYFPVSFSVDRENLNQQGFSVDLDRVRQLPGAPDHETVDFVISFDPRGANMSLGVVDTLVPINIVNGPQICILLRAHVTMPDMEISTDSLDFGDVKCGECKVITVQLHNHKYVRCEWSSVVLEKNKNKIHRTVPMHLRRKMKVEASKANTFEMMPPAGSLMPGQRINVQVKFMPTEDKFYEQRMPIRIGQSSQRLLLISRGQGLEPRLDFDHNLVHFGPILPHSIGDEQEIIVRNPCPFPIEFYNLECDKTYLEEEKILRLMKGYDEYNTILLPPRPPGEKLPQELLDYFDEQVKKLENIENSRKEAEDAAEQARKDLEDQITREMEEIPESAAVSIQTLELEDQIDALGAPGGPPQVITTAPTREPTAEPFPIVSDKDSKVEDMEEKKDTASSIGVGELEITPVSAAIARHLGIDLSPEGKAARNRRGIVIVVHGAPMSGKTTTAVMLAKKYEAALLSVDGIIMEAISNGNSPAGLRAKELCADAARRAEEMKVLEGEEAEKKNTGALSVEALTAHTQGQTGLQPNAAHSMVQSLASNRKTSVISEQKSKDKHHGSSVLTGAKTAVNTSSAEGGTGSQVPSSPPPLAGPTARRLSISASVAGDDGLMSCILPVDLMVEILAERLQLNDCQRGVVFDSLETLFSASMTVTAHAILKALNNRKYIYFMTLKLDYQTLKEREKKEQEEDERLAQEAEEEERRRLEEMSEDEYDALGEEKKAKVDEKRLEIKKERIRKELEEKMERERIEREFQEAEMRRLEEEKQSKRKGRKGAADAKDKDGKDVKKGAKPSQEKVSQPKAKSDLKGHEEHVTKTASNLERPESHQTEKSDDDGKKKKHGKEGSKEGKMRPISNEVSKESQGQLTQEDFVRDPIKDADIHIMQKFRTFEYAQKDILDLLSVWDRSIGQLHRPASPSEKSENVDDVMHPTSGKKGKGKDKDKHDKEKEKERERLKELERAEHERAAREIAGHVEGESAIDGPGEGDDGIGIPNIIIDCNQIDIKKTQEDKIIPAGKLPSPGEILDGLGLGPIGPPIPPAAEFAVVPYPAKRRQPFGSDPSGHYVFIASSLDDPNVITDDKSKEGDDEVVTPDRSKEDHTPTRSRKDKLKPDGSKERKKSAGRKPRRNSLSVQGSPPPGPSTPVSDIDGQRLNIFRWIVPAQGQVVLRLRFQSEDLGQFDQTMNFEIMGTRRRYQLFCRGICAFPTISREPRIVFPQRKKNKKSEEIVHKKYILMNEIFEFGPLLVGKSREKYKEGKYPENMETLTIQNTSPLEADINLCFLNDSKGETFLLDPPNMVLKSGESAGLTVWAYPKASGTYEDAIVCCIRENPEPIIFKIVCYGVRPEIEMDKKQLHFDRVLLHRKDTKTIYLRNSTLLPVAWKVSGMESLGDDFSVAAESGIIDAKSEYALNAHFRAMKPITTSKKSIRLEVSDVENIMGLVQTENIQVIAEAYDIALDMSFPKGADAGIDFGIIRVLEETKQTCSMKNKGKYEIAFNFILENPDPSGPDVNTLFSVIPHRGTLAPVDRPSGTQVQILFKAKEEVVIRDMPILRCQVIEPNLGDGGETIASIPVKISVKSVFSKYTIIPMSDISFGSLVVNSKKTRSFVIENKGEFDFKYTIQKFMKVMEQQLLAQKPRPPIKQNDRRTKSRDGSSSGRSVAPKQPKRAESIRSEITGSVSKDVTPRNTQQWRRPRQETIGGGQAKLVLGMFTIFPAFGSIQPNQSQTITVDCVAESPGKCEEDIVLDISDRDPTDHKDGIPYRLFAEACLPSINVGDIGSIFEEHRVCKNLTIWQQGHQIESGGVYGEDENRFVFNNVIVGNKAQARFKIINTSKVPCDVVFSIKPVQGKHMPKQQDIFEIEPTRAQIVAHGYTYATVTFCPPSMQSFTAVFEAALEGLPQSLRGRSLNFEVHGDGNLPRVSIQKPTVRNRKGQPLALFKRILVGRSETLPLILFNDGTLPSKVDIDLVDPDDSFNLKPMKGTNAIMNTEDKDQGISKLPHTASIIIAVGETASFDVIFKPVVAQRSQANIKLSVVNNQYEDSIIQLVGEGYEDTVTFDNISNINFPINPEFQEGNMADDDVEAAKSNHIHFGDCFIKEPYIQSLTLTNHSNEDCIRFAWPEVPELKFSPQVGHLHASCSKDITITFKSDEVKQLQEQAMSCKLSKITFDKPTNDVADWDDRMRVMKWVDVVQPMNSASADGTKTPSSATGRPLKKKIVETEVEPAYNEVAETTRSMDLLVSANADYCQYKCLTESVTFRDTLLFQTRIFEFPLSNKGTVRMDYSWKIVIEDTPVPSRSISILDGVSVASHDIGSCVSFVSDTDCVPFTIEPSSGSLDPGKKQFFTVKFSPITVQEYDARFICMIPNLQEGRGPVIGVRGHSLLPYCHFELEDSDYVSGARRNPELRGPNGSPPGAQLDPNTRVIEFEAIGVDVPTIRRFNIVNPTNQPYNFMWINEDDPNPKIVNSFQCLTTKGVAKSGKKNEISFEFISNQLGIVESFWRFVIPEQNISIPFVLVGDTKEPRITFDRSHFNYKSLLIGHEAMETVHVINNEDIPFHFAFAPQTCFSAGHAAHLEVEPMNGLVPAKSMFPINLYFMPTTDNEVNFNLICNVKQKTQPLTLNIKAEGYTMSSMLTCEDSQGSKMELVQNGLNEINFGEVEINDTATRNLYIINSGKFNFDYTWELNERSGKRQNMVIMESPVGAVNQGESEKCVLSFSPPHKTSLKGCELKLSISNGPVYYIAVVGYSVSPGLQFSFPSHNFGPSFVYRAGMPNLSVALTLMNRDKKEISVDCLYQNTAHLSHNFDAMVLAPGQNVAIIFNFFPREARSYHECVEFEVNGLSKHTIEFRGEGTEMKIEVANPKQKIVNFKALRLGQTMKKQVNIINKSPAALTFNLAITPSQGVLQSPGVLTVYPTTDITLEPHNTKRIDVTFSPKTRIPQFTEEVVLECAGMFQPLFVLTGLCQGIEITLDMESIPFGAVVQNSQSTRKLLMTNTGDIGARFDWDVAKFAPDFSIEPVQGYISPGMEVTFEVNFHPKDIHQDIRYDNLKCHIEGGKPLKLTLTGMCINVQPVKEMQHFTTHVRNREVKNLMIMNRTNQLWKLRPVIDGEFYSGPDTLIIEPQQTKSYELAYHPLTTTGEGKKHVGSVFFPLPDGTGLLYNIQGTSEAPKPNNKIQRDIPCKTSYTELLPVNNWLKKPQRFKVKFEMMKPDKLDLGTTLKGLDYIDVPGHKTKDYKLHHHAHKEGQSQFKVMFTNEVTGEYQFFEVIFKSVRPGVMKTIDLNTPVRQSVQTVIMLENPLSQPVTFTSACPVAEILMPAQLHIPAQSEGGFNIEYLPLKVGESQAHLELNSNELGLYMYDLNLKAFPAGPEKAIYFRANLGTSQIQMAKFLNFAKQKTDYTCKVDNADFHVDKSVAAAPGSSTGTEVAIEVNFEPSKLGESRATLTVNSNTGGEYTFPLYGTCLPPKPQGPYTIKAGSNTSITFRNVFPHTTQFTFQVDNPAFHVAKTGDNIRAHKDNRIVIGFDGSEAGSKGAVMGKLTVTCAKSAGGPSSVQWVYYLKGIST